MTHATLAQASSSMPTRINRENRIYHTSVAVIFVALFAFNALTLSPPPAPAALLGYAVITLALAGGRVVVAMRLPVEVESLGRVAAGLLFESVLLFATALLLRGRAELYFYLAGFGGMVGLRLVTGRWRWSLVYLAWLIGLSWLNYSLLGVASVLLGDLPYFGVIALFAWFGAVQGKHRAQLDGLTARLAQANEQLRDHAARAEALAVAQERNRLAHEIHDSVGHTLTALDVQLELLLRLPTSAQRRQIGEQARALLKSGLADVRRAVRALRPAALEALSLPEAIGELVHDFDQSSQIETTWQITGAQRALPPRCTLPLFRTVQEALTNVQRHASTTQRVELALQYTPETVTLTVTNAPSRPPSVPPASGREESGGFGLRGLRERAEALGGTFQAGANETGGFRVEMRLPVSSEHR